MNKLNIILIGSALIAAIFFVSTPGAVKSLYAKAAIPSLKDDEKCEQGKDCTCVHVTCNVGCKCDIQFGIGICIDCPIPPTGITAMTRFNLFKAFAVLFIISSIFKISRLIFKKESSEVSP